MIILNYPSSPTPTEKAFSKLLAEEQEQTNEERTVRFNNRVKRRHIECIPEEEHKNIWYTYEDHDEAYRRDEALRECISANKALYLKNVENLNAQGFLTEKQLVKGRMVVGESIVAVLVEQERQEMAFFGPNTSGKFALDVDKIAEAYSSHSQESLEEAQTRATRHQRHVQDISCDPSESSSLSPLRSIKRRTPTRRSPRSRAPVVRKLIPRPGVFVLEGSSRMATCTPPAA